MMMKEHYYTQEEMMHIKAFLNDLPSFTPKEIYDLVRSYGYIGQDQAVKAVSLMAFRHIKRLKNLFLKEVPVHELPSKENYMLIGPTGCGKTFLIELVFNRILQIPSTIIDITTYSETGYVGQDPIAMLTRLVYAADQDYTLASLGVICIDEFDKLATSQNNAVFSGAGTTKDVGGLGVQKELLKMLEGAELDVPSELSHSSYAPRETMRTHNISFIACGAFSGFKHLLNQEGKFIGFKGQNNVSKTKIEEQKIAYRLQQADLNKVMHFEKYGLMPELVGRFARLVPFHPLSKQHLKDILYRNTLKKYQKEFLIDNCKLVIDDAVLNKVVEEAYKRETGARGIRTSLLTYIEEACFELYSAESVEGKQVRIFLKDKLISWEILAV